MEKLERFYRWLIPPLIENRFKGYLFLFSLVGVFFLSLALFYTTDVTVKILPLDNKPEFNVVINMPEGTALPKTANLAREMTEVIRDSVPEVTALQTYVGTASPYNFNGMVRHYYLRRESWQADIQVQLKHKSERERTSHDLAVEVRRLLTPIAEKAGGRIQVVEMPPGPPVLQSVVAEVTGPDPVTRITVAQEMTKMFEKSTTVVDVDNYIEDVSDNWRFEVDTEKAVRRGISVDTINRNLAMAMGGVKLGDVKRGTVLEPTYIVIQAPLEVRSRITTLGDIPINTPTGQVIPLGELGRFVKSKQDPVIYHKDLRPVEYVTGEVEGRLDAPIYGMSEIEEMLENYTTPDGVVMSGHYLGAPDSYKQSAFEWTGEWTVTYETFRDMGLAFGVALVLIYMLVVWEFGNFTLPAIIMAPIPLTLIGIVPGHWLLDAKFTATSMIGFIALAGIIVRNSILLVDFSQQEILRGTPVREAVILACKARTRPIIITALALVAGSSVILTDFIFQGMAISLLSGALVSTLLTLLVIPLGCISAEKAFIKPQSEVDLTHHSLAQPELENWGDVRKKYRTAESCKVPSPSVAKTRQFLEKYNPGMSEAKKEGKEEDAEASSSKVASKAEAVLSRDATLTEKATVETKSESVKKSAPEKKSGQQAEDPAAGEKKSEEKKSESEVKDKSSDRQPQAKTEVKTEEKAPEPESKTEATPSTAKAKAAPAKRTTRKSPARKPAAKKAAGDKTTARKTATAKKPTARSKATAAKTATQKTATARKSTSARKTTTARSKSAAAKKTEESKESTATTKAGGYTKPVADKTEEAKKSPARKSAPRKRATAKTGTKATTTAKKTAAKKPATKKTAAKTTTSRRRGIRLKGGPQEET